jgi:hypothetical protein
MGCDYYIEIYITLLLDNNDEINLLYDKSGGYFSYMSDSDDDENIDNIEELYYKKNKILMSNDRWIKQQYKNVYYDFIVNNLTNAFTYTNNKYQYFKDYKVINKNINIYEIINIKKKYSIYERL